MPQRVVRRLLGVCTLQSKSPHVELTVYTQEEIVWLDICVDDVLGMEIGKCVGHLVEVATEAEDVWMLEVLLNFDLATDLFLQSGLQRADSLRICPDDLVVVEKYPGAPVVFHTNVCDVVARVDRRTFV